jgi:hypothetical protein
LASLMATKRHLFPFVSFSIKDGSEFRFLEYKWLGNATLREQYSAMYNIMRRKGDILAKVMESNLPCVTFRRDLSRPHRLDWNAFLHHLAFVQLSNGADEFRWNLAENGKFSADSIYRALIHP